MNGTKKFPHWKTNVKMVITAMPGIIKGVTMSQRLHPLCAVDPGRLLEVQGDAVHEPLHEPDTERQRGRHHEEDYGRHIVDEVEPGEHAVNGHQYGREGRPVEKTMMYRKGRRKRIW